MLLSTLLPWWEDVGIMIEKGKISLPEGEGLGVKALSNTDIYKHNIL